MSTRQLTRDLDGHPTEVLIQNYADRILVLITQIGKIGNLVQASIPATVPLIPAALPDLSTPNERPLPPPPAAIELTSLMGSAPSEHVHTLHSLYAAQVATIVWTANSEGPLEVYRKSVIVGIALRKSDGGIDVGISSSERSVFRGVMGMVQELMQ